MVSYLYKNYKKHEQWRQKTFEIRIFAITANSKKNRLIRLYRPLCDLNLHIEHNMQKVCTVKKSSSVTSSIIENVLELFLYELWIIEDIFKTQHIKL